jgi:hypothetical protein
MSLAKHRRSCRHRDFWYPEDPNAVPVSFLVERCLVVSARGAVAGIPGRQVLRLTLFCLNKDHYFLP